MLEVEKIVKKYRRKLLIEAGNSFLTKVNYNREDIKKIIPHREPFLYPDAITGIDLKNNIITGEKRVRRDDPVFEGHFPGAPVYPGMLQVETVGQLALCFYPFFNAKTTELVETTGLNVRLIRLHHVLFQHSVGPGDLLVLVAKLIEHDEFMYKGICQVVSDDKICTIVVGEFYLMD